ncbi:MAG: alpha/beta hydrolase, partial [Chloroflexi bacterium]
PHVRALDLPGHGPAGGTGLTSIRAYADWVAGRFSGSTPLLLAGHSMGGAIVLDLALRPDPPSWLAGLVLVGAGGRLRVHPDLFGLLETDFESAVDWIARRSIAPPNRDLVRPALVKSCRQAGPDVLRGDLEACDSFDVLDRLSDITIPTAVVGAREDFMTPLKYSERLREGIPGSTLLVAEGSGHMVMLERPETVCTAIEGLLSRVSAGEPSP